MELLFARRLKELRKEKEMTQVELGKCLGYGYTAIANYESGRNEPSLKDLIAICGILDVSADYLLGICDVRKPYVILEQKELDILYEEIEILVENYQRYLESKK